MKKLLSFILALCLVFLCACSFGEESGQGTETPSTQGSDVTGTEPDQTTEPVESTAAAELSVEDIYFAFLSELCVRLNKIIGDDTYLDGFDTKEGMIGVAEIASLSKTKMLDDIGYTITDINKDGVSELLLLQIDELNKEVCNGTRILCVFTVVDGEKTLVFEGHSRNRYYLLDDASIYNEGSNGAAYTCFGTYAFESGNSELTCADFYFTDLDADMKPLLLHNETGEWDAASSEAFDGNEDAFWAVQSSFSKRIQTIDLNALSSYEG